MQTDERMISEQGAAFDRAERLTNWLPPTPDPRLTDDETADVAAALEPIAQACKMTFPYPNLIGTIRTRWACPGREIRTSTHTHPQRPRHRALRRPAGAPSRSLG